MNHERKWTPMTVKKRLEEIIKNLDNNEQIIISEKEIRELQHFFNERSAIFLKQANQALKQIELKKRHPYKKLKG